MEKRGIGTLGIIIIAVIITGAAAAGGYAILSGGGTTTSSDTMELWVAPYVPEQYGKEPQYYWASEILDNPDQILDTLEVEIASGTGLISRSDELKDLPGVWEGKGIKYEIEFPNDLELTIEAEQKMEDYISAGLGKGGDVDDEDEWSDWNADDWQDLALDIVEETYNYKYDVPGDANQAIVAVRYYDLERAWVWTTIYPENLREVKKLSNLVSLKAYNEANDEFFEVGYNYEDGWGVWVPTDTIVKFVVEEPEPIGYEFTYWWDEENNEVVSENEVLQIGSSELNAGDTHYFSANYQEKVPEVTLDISTASPHSVSPESGIHTYEAGEKVNITAIPSSGYDFVKWTGDKEAIEAIDNENARQTSIVMNNDYQIEPVFDRLVNLHISATEGGSVIKPETVDGSGGTTLGVGTDGENVELSAEPDEGYKFVGWSGDTQKIDDPTEAETTITLEYDSINDPDQSVKAEFEPIILTLTVSSTENGRAENPGEGVFEYNYGEIVDLKAVPETGQEFAGWTDIDTIEDRWEENTTIEMLDNYELLADFDPVTYLFEYMDGEGSVSDDQGKIVNCRSENIPCSAEYVGVEKVVFTAEPDNGWEVSEWWDGEGGQTRTLYTENGSKKYLWVTFEQK